MTNSAISQMKGISVENLHSEAQTLSAELPGDEVEAEHVLQMQRKAVAKNNYETRLDNFDTRLGNMEGTLNAIKDKIIGNGDGDAKGKPEPKAAPSVETGEIGTEGKPTAMEIDSDPAAAGAGTSTGAAAAAAAGAAAAAEAAAGAAMDGAELEVVCKFGPAEGKSVLALMVEQSSNMPSEVHKLCGPNYLNAATVASAAFLKALQLLGVATNLFRIAQRGVSTFLTSPDVAAFNSEHMGFFSVLLVSGQLPDSKAEPNHDVLIMQARALVLTVAKLTFTPFMVMVLKGDTSDMAAPSAAEAAVAATVAAATLRRARGGGPSGSAPPLAGPAGDADEEAPAAAEGRRSVLFTTVCQDVHKATVNNPMSRYLTVKAYKVSLVEKLHEALSNMSDMEMVAVDMAVGSLYGGKSVLGSALPERMRMEDTPGAGYGTAGRGKTPGVHSPNFKKSGGGRSPDGGRGGRGGFPRGGKGGNGGRGGKGGHGGGAAAGAH